MSKVILVIVDLLVVASLIVFYFLKIEPIEFLEADTSAAILELTITTPEEQQPGAGYTTPPTETKVILRGKAYPLGSVTLLQDGKVIVTSASDSQANFEVEITDITAGIWTFGLWAEDKEGRKSIISNFTVSVTLRMTTTISGIFLPPTIELSKTKLQRGEVLNIYGQTVPQSEVSISVDSLQQPVKKTVANEQGEWDSSFNTSVLGDGIYTIRAKATSPEGLISPYSKALSFSISIKKKMPEVLCPNADLNGDGKVNLVDFSILLYWWETDNACCDQNRNEIVDLPDFSIMMYHWTG